MKRNLFACFGLIALIMWSCSNRTNKDLAGDNIILQEEDGTLMLKLEKAACYSDASDPSSNTAEWQVSISKPGSYRLWISSATKDTMTLNYSNSVKIHLLENDLEVNPVCDKVVQNSADVSYPFYRADSFVGSFYFQDPGVYNIQVISEKVISKELWETTAYLSESTRLMSLILEPLRR